MSTGIEWTEETWNPVTGCDKVSPGCAHCYAEGIAKRLWATTYPAVMPDGTSVNAVPVHIAEEYQREGLTRPRTFTDVQCHEDRLDQPLRWKKPRKVFVNSMSDLFHEDVPDAFIDRVFAVMAVTPWHTYQILTKRADRMRDYCSALTLARLLPWMNDNAPDGAPLTRETPAGGFVPTGAVNLCTVARRAKERAYRWNPDAMPLRTAPPPLPNVWLGVSVENQRFADERIPLLLQTPAAVRFISAEPLLGPVDLTNIHISYRNSIDALRGWHDSGYDYGRTYLPQLDWVIVGGESGTGARPFDIRWARSIVQQCQAAGVACFVKQMGSNPVCRNDERDEPWPGCTVPIDDDYEPREQGETAPLVFRNKKGGDPAEWPADLNVRQFPEACS